MVSDIRYNRGLYWIRGEDETEEKIICDTVDRIKLRWNIWIKSMKP